MKIFKGFLIIVVIILLGAGAFYLFKQKNSAVIYKNSLLGYEIAIQPGWHISEEMTKKMDDSLFVMQLANSIGCDIASFINEGGDIDATIAKFEDCMKKSPEFAKVESEQQDFLKNWTIGNALYVFVTKINSEEENKFSLFDIISPGETLPEGSFITIRPISSALDFDEATSSNKSGLKTSFFYLEDKTKSYLYDWRDSKIRQNGLSLAVPISTAQKLFDGEGVKTIKAINIITTAGKGSQEEKDFMNSIESLKIFR